ncbi:MAG: glycosyltransferase family 4 protein [Cetobacterium sp.]
MIKVGYIVSTLENSGPVNIMYNIIKYLDKKIIEVYIYTLSKEKENSRLEDFKRLGCIIKKIEITNREIYFGNLKKVEKILEEDKVQILHSHCLRSNIILAKIKIKIKKICTIHANIKEDYKFKFGRIKGYILEKIYLRTLKNIEDKICCSNSVLNDMRHLTREKLSYITNGVDLENYKIEKSKIMSRDILNLDKKEIIFISVGSLCDRKDSYFIAKNITKMGLKNYKLIFLGEGKQREKIEKLNNPNIILTGKIKNIKEYLNAADIYISASNSEGMPNSVLEALAFRLPVLLSNIESHQEIYNLNKECGEIFKKSSDFNKKVELIIKKDYKNLSEKAYSIVSKYLNAVKMSQYYEQYYLKGSNK